jgi:peptidyl-prolyl isomerase, gliding motility-associated
LKESAMKNKALLASEEALIDSIIKKDTLHNFIDSQHGFKFYYLNQNPEAHYTAQFGDIVTYDYSLSDLQGNQLYQEKPDGEYKYYVDKEEVFQGLRSALKLLKEKESGVFYFPSSVAYGYRGDKDKISFNQPIIAKIEVFKIEKNQEDVKPRPE